ncbi:protoporphyrinogen oxidase [Viridothelium virens]|uniref:Protoporphyrinogen oxidase n=1 Tax=Viridothelium virens TaxID=1048519 RepID=A0A6A6H4K7_VIRVR|nr:protoporphyrinogen oxidase [Viridothelium virens]
MLAQRCVLQSLRVDQRHQLHRNIRSLGASLRRYSTSDVKDVAVLGGGITGLATAHNLVRELPNVKVSIYEASPRIGGWLLSKRVDVPGGSVVFEQGPRTLRPAGSLTTAQLIQDLGLVNDTIFSSKTSPAALNRFVYYPDHLVRLPVPSKNSNFAQIIFSILSEPLLRGLIPPFLFEGFTETRSHDLQDESVGSFISRRLSKAVANNLLSAMMHGIYAGDVWKLSIKSIFPQLWELEGRFGSVAGGLLYLWSRDGRLVKMQDVKAMAGVLQSSSLNPELLASFRSSSVYTFKNGISQLIDRLAETLRQNPNVTIKTDTKIRAIRQDAQHQIELDLPDQSKAYHSHMISTISAQSLSNLARRPSSLDTPVNISSNPESTYLPSLRKAYATTVQVVSLYYSDPNLIPYQGFGYLIPQSVPFEQNPELALGVIFDSSYSGTPSQTPGETIFTPASSQVDAPTPSLSQDTVPGTRLTVILGGHWWDGYTYYPSEQQGLELATSLLQRHLDINVPPTAYNVVLQKDCIPQYTVGHSARMRAAHGELKRAFKGRLRVAGSWYTGVGVNDCVRAAWSVARGLKDGLKTGLEEFDEEAEPWVMVPKNGTSSEVKEKE